MDIIMKNKIKALRSEGYGYGKIAELLNISKSQVSSFCRRNNIDCMNCSNCIHCAYCGLPVSCLNHHKKKRFCSDSCKSKYYNELYKKEGKIHGENLTCKCCGKIFNSKWNKNQVFCSHQCYITYRYKGGKKDDGNSAL